MIISTFASVNKAYIDQQIDLPWEDMAVLLSAHFPAEAKDDVPLYNLIRFKDATDPTVELGRKYKYVNGERTEEYTTIPGTVRRCKDNVLELHGIVLDVDDSMNIADIQYKLEGLEYLLYTTFRHTAEHNKFRVIIPFSRPLLVDDVVGRQDSIMETFPGVDRASFSVSQSFYFHSGNDSARTVIWNKGIMIDPYAFEYREPVAHALELSPETSVEDLTEKDVKEVERVLTALKQKKPILGRNEWMRVTWMVADKLGKDAGIFVMSQFYPEQQKGEYNSLFASYNRAKSPKFGSLVKMAGLDRASKAEAHKQKYQAYLQEVSKMEELRNALKEMK